MVGRLRGPCRTTTSRLTVGKIVKWSRNSPTIDHGFRLNLAPELTNTNLRHRRLVRRAGPEAQHAFQQALTELTTWFQTGQPELRQRWRQRLAQLDDDPYLDPHHPSRDRIQLATYPETVTLTSVFTSPHWRHDIGNV